MFLPRILGGALAAALLIAPAAHADVLDTHDGVRVAAHDGTVLWNRYEQAHYGLVGPDGKSVDIRTSKTPFDVSLGTDADGRLRAVYARDNHVIYMLDVKSGRERSLHLSGANPSLSKGVLAFSRGATVYVGRLGGVPRAIAHIAGKDSKITGVSNSPRGVAFSAYNDPDYATAMYFKPAGGGALRKLARGGYGEENRKTHASPVLDGGTLYWAFSNQSEFKTSNGWVIRYDLATHRAQAAAADGFLDAVAVDGSRLITSSFSQDLSAGPQGADQVATLDAPQWAAPPSEAGLPR
jgi:hypothetical protein